MVGEIATLGGGNSDGFAVNAQSVVSELTAKGVVFLADQTKEKVAFLMRCLGSVIYTTDVKVNPQSRALITSAKALDFHTDHHKAKWVLWRCLEQTDDGGESVFVDAARVYQKLGDTDKRELSKIMLYEHKIFDDDEDFCPLVRQEGDSLKFYYSFWMVGKNLSEPQKKAVAAFRSAISEETPVEIKMQKNDVIIVDNHRILHGRREIKGRQNRFLKRFWIQSITKKEKPE